MMIGELLKSCARKSIDLAGIKVRAVRLDGTPYIIAKDMIESYDPGSHRLYLVRSDSREGSRDDWDRGVLDNYAIQNINVKLNPRGIRGVITIIG